LIFSIARCRQFRLASFYKKRYLFDDVPCLAPRKQATQVGKQRRADAQHALQYWLVLQGSMNITEKEFV